MKQRKKNVINCRCGWWRLTILLWGALLPPTPSFSSFLPIFFILFVPLNGFTLQKWWLCEINSIKWRRNKNEWTTWNEANGHHFHIISSRCHHKISPHEHKLLKNHVFYRGKLYLHVSQASISFSFNMSINFRYLCARDW